MRRGREKGLGHPAPYRTAESPERLPRFFTPLLTDAFPCPAVMTPGRRFCPRLFCPFYTCPTTDEADETPGNIGDSRAGGGFVGGFVGTPRAAVRLGSDPFLGVRFVR